MYVGVAEFLTPNLEAGLAQLQGRTNPVPKTALRKPVSRDHQFS